MQDFKRPADMALVATAPSKRARGNEVAEVSGPPRTSNLQSPIMLLNGHEGEIYSGKFSPDGTCLASVGFDMRICTLSLSFSLRLPFSFYSRSFSSVECIW